MAPLFSAPHSVASASSSARCGAPATRASRPESAQRPCGHPPCSSVRPSVTAWCPLEMAQKVCGPQGKGEMVIHLLCGSCEGHRATGRQLTLSVYPVSLRFKLRSHMTKGDSAFQVLGLQDFTTTPSFCSARGGSQGFEGATTSSQAQLRHC